MGDILYEASFEFVPVLLIPVFFMVLSVVLPRVMQKSYTNKLTKVDFTIVKNFFRFVFIFAAVFALIVGVSQAHMFHKTVGAYRKGDYHIVEGYVENFHPMPYEGKSDETFEINGVEFSYSDYVLQSGYHNAKSHGGVITGDGQHLRIGYVYYNESYGNVIVYIEQLS